MHPSEEIEALARERAEARSAKDFARADALRDAIREHGFIVHDTPAGWILEAAAPFETVAPASVPNDLERAPTSAFSLHVLYEGFPADLQRFLSAFAATDPSGAEVVIVDNASDDGEMIERAVAEHGWARALHLDRAVGWAEARNAGLKTSAGAIVVLVDLSIEPTGDVLGPLNEAFAGPEVGLAGPFGLVTDDLREFRPADGPWADAIEGYVLAVRREALARALIRERFTWYRNADIDLSFQVRDQGWRARVVPLPVATHEHRGWAALDGDERDRRSRKNHAAFYRRWGDRLDLLTERGGEGG